MSIQLPQLNKILSCNKGDNLFRTLREQGVAIASSCNGDGVCGKCVVNIVAGDEKLSPPTELETRIMKKYNYTPPQRIACQCAVLGDSDSDLQIKTTYW